MGVAGPALDHSQRDAELRNLCGYIATNLPSLCGSEAHHPLELGLRLHEAVCGLDSPVATILARAMCASPFDAAIHDASGIAVGQSAFELYDSPQRLPLADQYFDCGALAAVRRCLIAPRRELDAWLVVGPDDPLAEEFASTVARHGYRCFKLKVGGRDNQRDVARTVEIFRAARQAGVARPRLSVDSNEANPDAQSVLDYLQRLRQADPGALASLSHLEQPTARDIQAYRYDWHAVASIKPVLLDEGLNVACASSRSQGQRLVRPGAQDLQGPQLLAARRRLAHQHGMLLSLQDLTNPGIAAIHAALLASRLNTINGVELNSMQFTPEANAPWLPR